MGELVKKATDKFCCSCESIITGAIIKTNQDYWEFWADNIIIYTAEIEVNGEVFCYVKGRPKSINGGYQCDKCFIRVDPST